MSDTVLDNGQLPHQASAPPALPAAAARGLTASPWWTLLFTAIVAAPIHLIFYGDPSYDSWRYRPYLALVDVLLFALVAARIVPTLRGLRDRHDPVSRSLAALLAVLALSFALHPGALGAVTLLRLAAIVVVAAMIGRAERQHLTIVVQLFSGVAAAEAAIAMGQKITGHALGLALLGESTQPFNPLGTHLSPTGTIFYPYPLAGLGLVAASISIAAAARGIVRGHVAFAGACAGGILVGLSFSVAGALSAAGLIAVGLIALVLDRSAARRLLAGGLLVFALSCAGAGVMDYGGWLFKGERSTQGIEAAGNGRVGMLKEAKAMVERWPAIGIGPGNFMKVRDAHPELKALADQPQPVHMVPFLIVVEGGIPAALALGALGVSLLLGFRRSGWLGPMIAVSFSGFLLFDHYPWLFGIGTMTLGVWFGVMTALARLGTSGQGQIPMHT
jgi:hypothetical protein